MAAQKDKDGKPMRIKVSQSSVKPSARVEDACKYHNPRQRIKKPWSRPAQPIQTVRIMSAFKCANAFQLIFNQLTTSGSVALWYRIPAKTDGHEKARKRTRRTAKTNKRLQDRGVPGTVCNTPARLMPSTSWPSIDLTCTVFHRRLSG